MDNDNSQSQWVISCDESFYNEIRNNEFTINNSRSIPSRSSVNNNARIFPFDQRTSAIGQHFRIIRRTINGIAIEQYSHFVFLLLIAHFERLWFKTKNSTQIINRSPSSKSTCLQKLTSNIPLSLSAVANWTLLPHTMHVFNGDTHCNALKKEQMNELFWELQRKHCAQSGSRLCDCKISLKNVFRSHGMVEFWYLLSQNNTFQFGETLYTVHVYFQQKKSPAKSTTKYRQWNTKNFARIQHALKCRTRECEREPDKKTNERERERFYMQRRKRYKLIERGECLTVRSLPLAFVKRTYTYVWCDFEIVDAVTFHSYQSCMCIRLSLTSSPSLLAQCGFFHRQHMQNISTILHQFHREIHIHSKST